MSESGARKPRARSRGFEDRITRTESRYSNIIWPVGNTSKETLGKWPHLRYVWNVSSIYHTGKYPTKKAAEEAFVSVGARAPPRKKSSAPPPKRAP